MDDQPAEWVESITATNSAYKRVKSEIEERQQKEQEKKAKAAKSKKSGGGRRRRR